MDTEDSQAPSTSFVICELCSKKFGCVKLLNRHKKRIHKIVPQDTRKSWIICPICEVKDELKSHEVLLKHLRETHEINVELQTLQFPSIQEYELWKNDNENIDCNYAVCKTRRARNFKEVVYICNRSDYKGYQPKYNIRTEKASGTIRIKGMCPSKLICKFHDNGFVSIRFWNTHAGHDMELRTSHLPKSEKDIVVDKLKTGVSVDRILHDARNLKNAELQRVHLINRDEITYLARKYNIDNKRDCNEMVAAAMKVQEWNANGKNFAFFYKPQGFMNSVMEDKLKSFSNIICMDGTHGTNRKGMDLTIVLIKDDKNAGFPVAFFLTNRLDQEVQEVFLGALKAKLGQNISAEYFMSDDDPKYHNAWVKIMESQPKRLLCTWHVVKNWNIQGKKKIKDEILRKEMKKEMKRLINETNEDRFIQNTNEYLIKLQEAHEVEFVNYLLKYYFQDDERIRMWAHCYRKNAGINTNMAIESLNNLLKTNQLKRSARITIEKLLDTIEELVDIKMWKRVTDIVRPNANNYQDRIITKAHKKAEAQMIKVKVFEGSESGKFLVKSFTKNHYYNIENSGVCENNCRTLYCRVCKICIHRYKCDCPEYEVRNTMCKHVHLIRMYEQRTGNSSLLDDTALALAENSVIKSRNKEEIAHFIEEKCMQQQEEKLDDQDARKLRLINHTRWLEALDGEVFDNFMHNILGAVNKADQANLKLTKKRKMEKQEYFLSKKHRK